GIEAAKAAKAADETLTVAKDADEAANVAKEADQADIIMPRKVFRMGEGGADDMKQPEVPEGSWQSDGTNLDDGEHTFVVMRDGSVRSMHDDQLATYGDFGGGHSSLSQE